MAYLDSTGLQKQIQYIKAYVANQISAIASNGTVNRATADGLGNNIAETYATKAELSAIDLPDYMPKSGGTFTGNVMAPTPEAANNSTKVATTAWVNTALRYYGTCSTAAATMEKTVACTSFILATGARIVVKFTVTNTAANPTLNVNSTGAKAIQYSGAAISAGYLVANRTYEFVYDGTNYQLIGDINTNTTNSAGAGNSTAKLFLVGTTAQSTGTSYSNANVYATNGALHAASISTGGNVVVGGTANTNYLQLPSGIKLY